MVKWSEGAFERVYALSRRKKTGEFPVPLVRAIAFIDENHNRQIQLAVAIEAPECGVGLVRAQTHPAGHPQADRAHDQQVGDVHEQPWADVAEHEGLVAHAGSIALAARFSCAAPALEGLILVMPEPGKLARLLSHLKLG